MGIKLDTDSVRYISIFESITGAIAKDCIVDDDTVIFVVKEGTMGLAIGKKGSNINKVKKILNKNIKLIEFSPNIEIFIRNILYPAKIKNIQIIQKKDKKTVLIKVDPHDRAVAIGKNGYNIRKARILLQRHYDVDDVKISR